MTDVLYCLFSKIIFDQQVRFIHSVTLLASMDFTVTCLNPVSAVSYNELLHYSAKILPDS